MEVSLEVIDSTARALQVTVPQQRFSEQVERRLQRLARTVRLRGFRPGKVPMQIVRQRHLSEVYGEVVHDLTKDSLQEALVKEQVAPVVEPQVTVQEYGEDRPFKYQARFDVYPLLEEGQVEKLQLKDPGAEVLESEFEDSLEQLQFNHAQWNLVERPVQSQDQVQYAYEIAEGEGEPPAITEQSKRNAIVIETRADVSLEPLRAALQGMQAGEETQVTLPLSAEEAQKGAGKLFRVRVEEVREPVLPAWEDEEFLSACKVDSKEALHEQVRGHLARERVVMRRRFLVAQIVRGLTQGDAPALPVPESLQQWCLQEHMREWKLESLDDTEMGRFLQQRALRDAQRITVFQALSKLNEVRPTEEQQQEVLRGHAQQYRDPEQAQQQIMQDPQARGMLEREAAWEAQLSWVRERVPMVEELLTLEQMKAQEMT